MAVANKAFMKAAIAQCPMIGEVETQAQQVRAVANPSESIKVNSPAVVYTAKSIVILSGIAMTYCLINYGRIFQNYLQW